MKNSVIALFLLLVVSGAHARNTTANTARGQERAAHTFTKPSGGMTSEVHEMRATSAPDAKLMGLTALGLVILQLRRKHKSLPQRRIDRLMPIADL
jgi:hypothetical protein